MHPRMNDGTTDDGTTDDGTTDDGTTALFANTGSICKYGQSATALFANTGSRRQLYLQNIGHLGES